MATQPMSPDWFLRLVKDSAAGHLRANRILALDQYGVENDTGRFKIGDGVKRWSELGFANVAGVTSVLPFPSAAARNIFEVDEQDGGFKAYRKLSARDRNLFTTLATPAANFSALNAAMADDPGRDHVIEIYFRLNKLALALGTAYTLGSNNADITMDSVDSRIKTLAASMSPSAIKDIVESSIFNGIVSDTSNATNKLMSAKGVRDAATTIAQQAATAAIATLVGSAPAALDTIYELAAELETNQSALTTILEQFGSTVTVLEQTFTEAEQGIARANIDAVGMDFLGSDNLAADADFVKTLNTAYTGYVVTEPILNNSDTRIFHNQYA